MMAEQPAGVQTSATGGQSGGMVEHVRELVAAVAGYLRARLALAGIEAKESLIHFAVVVGCLAMAVGVTVFGYLFFCIGLTVLIAKWTGVSPGWVILWLAGLHFVVAVGAAVFAVARLKKPVFKATLEELRKDQQWLNRK